MPAITDDGTAFGDVDQSVTDLLLEFPYNIQQRKTLKRTDFRDLINDILLSPGCLRSLYSYLGPAFAQDQWTLPSSVPILVEEPETAEVADSPPEDSEPSVEGAVEGAPIDDDAACG